MTIHYCTLQDVADYVGVTKSSMHNWYMRKGESFIAPAATAGRGNQSGKVLLNLWAEEQLPEIKEKYWDQFYKDQQRRAEVTANQQKRRNEWQREERRKKREKAALDAKRDLELLGELKESKPEQKKTPKVIPVPNKSAKLTFTPPSDDAQAYADEFQREQEEKAMQFLISRGLV